MPEFKLTLDPTEKIVFGGKNLGEEPATVILKITNPLKERVAFKVKCTSNEMFRIRPPVSALKAGETASINLVFNAGKTVPDSGKHYFALYYIVAKDDKPPRTLWSEHKGEVEGTKKMFVDFNKEGEAKKDDEKKDDKKEEEKKEEDKKEDKKEEKKEEKKEDKKEEKKEDEKKEEEDKEEKKE